MSKMLISFAGWPANFWLNTHLETVRFWSIAETPNNQILLSNMPTNSAYKWSNNHLIEHKNIWLKPIHNEFITIVTKEYWL